MNSMKIVKKSVNTESVFDLVNAGIMEALEDDISFDNDEHREALVALLEEILDIFMENDVITQGKVIFDRRNNRSFIRQKTILLEVHYRQPHCVNVSKIEYHISK